MLKIISTYTLTQYINKGEYGKVYKAIDHTTQQYVAIKMISLDKFIEKSKLIQLTKQQVQILSSLEKNQNIIKLKEIIKSNRFLYLVYEFCQGGTLQELCKKRGKLSQKEAIKISRQLINAYKSLYQNNIVHRDIKPDNIFFKQNTLKLADFGFCKQLKFPDDLTQTSLGSPLYMAPEVLNNDVYGSKADLWSCGIILYQMLFGVTPYATCNINELLKQYSVKEDVMMPGEKSFLSPVLVEMLKRMLCKDQFRRISWEEFFYEYQFTQQGEIKHKEKDFEYDLMKLMKRTSSKEGEQKKSELTSSNNKALKFDWSKITDMNSSVHSEECNQQFQYRNELSTFSSNNLSQSSKTIQHQQTQNSPMNHSASLKNIKSTQDEQIASLYAVKKAIKNFQNQHTKIYQLLTIIQSLLQSTKPHEYDSRIIYFLIYNLQHLLKTNISKVTQHLQTNSSLLQTLPEEKNKLQRLQRIFQKQHQDNSLKINSIKTTLITMEEVEGEIFRYPRKDIMRQVMKEYTENYDLEIQGILGMENGKIQCKQDAVKLLKVMWGVQLIYSQGNTNDRGSSTFVNNGKLYNKSSNFNYSNILSIKQQTTQRQVSALINRYLVQLGI